MQRSLWLSEQENIPLLCEKVNQNKNGKRKKKCRKRQTNEETKQPELQRLGFNWVLTSHPLQWLLICYSSFRLQVLSLQPSSFYYFFLYYYNFFYLQMNNANMIGQVGANFVRNYRACFFPWNVICVGSGC